MSIVEVAVYPSVPGILDELMLVFEARLGELPNLTPAPYDVSPSPVLLLSYSVNLATSAILFALYASKCFKYLNVRNSSMSTTRSSTTYAARGLLGDTRHSEVSLVLSVVLSERFTRPRRFSFSERTLLISWMGMFVMWATQSSV